MPTTTTCPSCNGPLRIPDELVGQRVRCPVCQTIFDASAPAPAPASPTSPAAPDASPDPQPPLWKNLNLELGGGESGEIEKPPAPASTPPPSSRKPDLFGAVEVSSSGTDEDPGPRPPAPPRPPTQERELPFRRPAPPPSGGPQSPVSRSLDLQDDDDRPPRRGPYGRDYRRRDTEPHRGTLILVLGVISLVSVCLSLCYGLGILIGLPLGITAWVLGNGDLRKIKNRQMDEEGLGITQAGWICGIIGTILNCLILLTCGVLLTVLLISVNSTANNPKTPFGRPVAPPPPVVKDE